MPFPLRKLLEPLFIQMTTPPSNSFEMKRVGATIFGELSNTGGKEEARQILSTILNRAKDNKQSLQAVISAPNQYQAFQGKQYDKFIKGDLDFLSKKKAQLVEEVMQEYSGGKLNSSNARFFQHERGKIKPSLTFKNG